MPEHEHGENRDQHEANEDLEIVGYVRPRLTEEECVALAGAAMVGLNSLPSDFERDVLTRALDELEAELHIEQQIARDGNPYADAPLLPRDLRTWALVLAAVAVVWALTVLTIIALG